MPRFYFDLNECGTVTVDPDGRLFADAEQARQFAIRGAREAMVGEIRTGNLCLGCCYVIRDQMHHEIGRVMFSDAVKLTGI